jgi:hypothetical protein
MNRRARKARKMSERRWEAEKVRLRSLPATPEPEVITVQARGRGHYIMIRNRGPLRGVTRRAFDRWLTEFLGDGSPTPGAGR